MVMIMQMSHDRRALGKGLSSLIPLGKNSDQGIRGFMECNVDDIIPSEEQPRKLFDKTAIDELAASIEEKGILQPLIARKIGGGKYEIIAGERRFRAAKQLRLEKVPVFVKEVDQQESLEIALIENLQREDLNPVEEALAFKELISKYQYTQDELARKIGKDRSSIANTLRLLKLPEEIRDHIISGKISMGHARALLGIENTQIQKKLALQIIDNNLSVREIENWIRNLKDNVEEEGDGTESEITHHAKSENPFKDVEENLRKQLKTRVVVKGKEGKGKIIIHFASKDALDNILESMLRDS